MIIEKQKRSDLHEGRNHGLGYSILEKKGSNYETYMAFTACKDYLNDLVYIENTGLNITERVHGYSHIHQNIFYKKRYFYLAICPIDMKGSNTWDLFEKCEELLFSNVDNIISHINKLEHFLDFGKSKTSLKEISNIDNSKDHSDKAIILKVPIYWIKNPVLISLYGLFIRCTFHIKEDLTIKQLLHKNNNTFINGDKYMLNTLCSLLDIKDPKKYFNMYEYNLDIKNLNNVHNYGIIGWLKKIIPVINFKEEIKKCW